MAFKYYKCIDSSAWHSQTDIRVNSKNSRKVKGLFSSAGPQSVVGEASASAIFHVFRADRTNCGDWWSLPAHYFTFPRHDGVLEINDYDQNVALAGSAIVGGGGLIGPAFKQLEHLVRNPQVRVIGWGLGNNMLDDKRTGYVASSAPLPNYIEDFDLLGIRDYVEGLRWVPCASCMHPVFSKSYAIEHEFVVFEHKRVPIAIDGYPRLDNSGKDIESIVAFLASGATVLTNSFHGAYWATLLGRKCVAFPFSSKFYGLRHAVSLGPVNEWKTLAAQARAYPEALYECRQANIEFYADVMALLHS